MSALLISCDFDRPGPNCRTLYREPKAVSVRRRRIVTWL